MWQAQTNNKQCFTVSWVSDKWCLLSFFFSWFYCYLLKPRFSDIGIQRKKQINHIEDDWASEQIREIDKGRIRKKLRDHKCFGKLMTLNWIFCDIFCSLNFTSSPIINMDCRTEYVFFSWMYMKHKHTLAIVEGQNTKVFKPDISYNVA